MRQYGAMVPRTALVTGGASGIGAALVSLLREGGCAVEVLDVQTGFDVSDPDAWERVGAVELACLNAGVVTGERSIDSLGDEAYRRAAGTNIDGVVFGTRRLARVAGEGTAIVATASIAGLTALDDDPIYTLTKHAVVGFVRSVAPQLAERGIRINAVAPGIVATPLLGDARRGQLEQAGFPLLRPEEVARVILLAGQSLETGQVWCVQPGRPPEPFRFPSMPGPRRADGTPAGPPPRVR